MVYIQYNVSNIKDRMITGVLDTGLQDINEQVIFPKRVRKTGMKEVIWLEWAKCINCNMDVGTVVS